MTITRPGTVIDSKVVNGTLTIQAAGVVVSNSLINGSVSTDENSSGYSFRVEDSVVDVGGQPGTGVGAVDFTMLRTEVRGGNRSVNCWENCEVRDSWVHGQFRDQTGVQHESGIRMGSDNRIIHNRIECDAPDVPPDGGCSAPLTGYGDFAAVQDVLVQDNYFGATTGGYCTYGGSSGGKPYSEDARDIRFIGNTYSMEARNDKGLPDCGAYGAGTDFDPSAPGNIWENNTYTNGSPAGY